MNDGREGRMNGGRADGRMNGRADGVTNGRPDGSSNGRMNGGNQGRRDGASNSRMDSATGGNMNGRMGSDIPYPDSMDTSMPYPGGWGDSNFGWHDARWGWHGAKYFRCNCTSGYVGEFCECEYHFKGSGTLLVRLYKDAGTPATECSPTKF